MNIPRFWAKAERSILVGRQQVHLVAWKGSDENLEDATRLAQATLEERIIRKQRGEKLGNYPKDGQPLREAIVEEINNPQGQTIALITRNAAGCLVLNTAQVMFVDLDFANQPWPWTLPTAQSLLKTIAGWFKPQAAKPPSPFSEEGLLYKVKEWQQQHPDWTIRVYRTRAGLRLLIAHDLFDPMAQSVQQAMDQLGADRRYQRLCQSQACFRARLTPKPHRIKGGKMKRPPVRYPWVSASEEKAQREWERTYHSRIGRFAVCKVLADLGSSPVHPDAEQILLLHDQYVLGDKPLA